MKTHIITVNQAIMKRRRDPKTHAIPAFARELTGFDKPTTFCMTPEENKKFNERLYLRNAR